MLAPACVRHPEPRVAPPPLGLDGAATYQAYREHAPKHFKMRHTVESTFGPRSEVIEGFLVVDLPDRFYVSARSPMGPALFEVKSVPPAPLEVSTHLAELSDASMAHYLARDIRRIYLQECPADVPVEARGDAFVVRCPLPVSDDGIADDQPDDAVELVLGPGADLRQKVFSRAGQPTAIVTYDVERVIAGVWLPHVIDLRHTSIPYRLRITLVAVDFGFDTSRIFGSARE